MNRIAASNGILKSTILVGVLGWAMMAQASAQMLDIENKIIPESPFDLGFSPPNYTAAQEKAVLKKYGYVDPTHLIPTGLLDAAILFFEFNNSKIVNRNVVSIVDFSRFSGDTRLFILDIKSGAVEAIHVAHGKGSDPDTKNAPSGTGYAKTFSNVVDSNMSSLGFYLVAETYQGVHGLSIRLDGLSSTNSNARPREIVVHGAPYVNETSSKQGRSDGCFALNLGLRDKVVNQISGGSILYAGVAGENSADEAAIAPLWEDASDPGRKVWTSDAMQIVETYGDALMHGSSDIAQWCPNYLKMTANEQASFWVYLVSAVAKYESGFDQYQRYQETSLGKDPITGQIVESEGLLQLSYQDVLKYPFCNEFDWSVDKTLSATSPQKSIFDIKKNLACGIRVLNFQVQTKGLIAYSGDQYWSTLTPGNKHSQVGAIQALTTTIHFCKK